MKCVIKTHKKSYLTTAECPERLSVAVPFIDRHFDEGHVAKNSIRGSFGDETYIRFADAREKSDQLTEKLL